MRPSTSSSLPPVSPVSVAGLSLRERRAAMASALSGGASPSRGAGGVIDARQLLGDARIDWLHELGRRPFGAGALLLLPWWAPVGVDMKDICAQFMEPF